MGPSLQNRLGVTINNGRIIAVGNPVLIRYSDDNGATWTAPLLSAPPLFAVSA